MSVTDKLVAGKWGDVEEEEDASTLPSMDKLAISGTPPPVPGDGTSGTPPTAGAAAVAAPDAGSSASATPPPAAPAAASGGGASSLPAWSGERRSKTVSFTVEPPERMMVVKRWQDMHLKDEIVSTLLHYNPPHKRPFRIHEIAIPMILEHNREPCVIHAPTGHGKTAAFTIPILQRVVKRRGPPSQGDSPSALVMTHSRELARQHQGKIRSYGAGVLSKYEDGSRVSPEHQVGLCVGSGDVKNAETAVQKKERIKLEKASNQAYVAVGTILKIKGLLSNGRIAGQKVGTLVFDEVDQLMKENLQDIIDIMRACPHAQPLFVSATFPDDSIATIKTRLAPRGCNMVRTNETARAVLQANFRLAPWEDKMDLIPRLNEQVPLIGKRMVFVQTTRLVDVVVAKFKEAGETDTIGVHANSHKEDERVKSRAMTPVAARNLDLLKFGTDDGTHNVLVCTDSLGRGIDIETTRAVINIELPRLFDRGKGATNQLDVSSYKHRIGRSTRSEGAYGLGINLVGYDNGEPQLLQQALETPSLAPYGPHYEVSRERVEIGGVIEVKFSKPDGGSEWRFAVVQKINPDNTVDVETEDDEKIPIPNVPLQHHTDVRIPFDYPALNEEIRLFQKKAGCESELIQCIMQNVYDNLDDLTAKAQAIIEELGESLSPENTAWRQHAATFLTDLAGEAIHARSEQQGEAKPTTAGAPAAAAPSGV